MTMTALFEDLDIIESSRITHTGVSYALARLGADLRLVVLEEGGDDWDGERTPKGKHTLTVATHERP
jgi:hypothetical protein